MRTVHPNNLFLWSLTGKPYGQLALTGLTLLILLILLMVVM